MDGRCSRVPSRLDLRQLGAAGVQRAPTGLGAGGKPLEDPRKLSPARDGKAPEARKTRQGPFLGYLDVREIARIEQGIVGTQATPADRCLDRRRGGLARANPCHPPPGVAPLESNGNYQAGLRTLRSGDK